MNFDDGRLGISPSEFAKVEEAIIRLYGDPDVVVLDEIQNVPGSHGILHGQCDTG